MAIQWIIFVVVMIHYVLTESTLINCTDCINESRINDMSNQADVLGDSKQLIDANYTESSTYSTELITNNTTMTIPYTTEIDTTVTLDITSYNHSAITTSPPEPEKNLALILGLTLGLGIPICLAIIGSLVYYFKIYRPKHTRIAILAY